VNQKRETLFQTRWLSVHRIGNWDFVERPNADCCVCVLAVTPADEIVLVEQFRPPVGSRVIEIPAGLVGDDESHPGETIADTARRELLEETGYHAGTVTPLLSSPTSAGMTSETTHVFLATDLERHHDGGGIGSEDIRVHLVPHTELRARFKQWERDGFTLDFKIHAALWAADL
jgi:ADP-ribose pyrophosphatase